MSFQVMNAQHRNFQREAKGSGDTCTHQQRSSQPGPLSVGDGVEVPQTEFGRGKSLSDEGQYPPDMVARGKFRHYAAVLAVHFRLRIKRVA